METTTIDHEGALGGRNVDNYPDNYRDAGGTAVFIGRASFRMGPFVDQPLAAENRSQHGEILVDGTSDEVPSLEDLVVLVPPADLNAGPADPAGPDTSAPTAGGLQQQMDADSFTPDPDVFTSAFPVLVRPRPAQRGMNLRARLRQVPALPLAAALIAGVTLTLSAQTIMGWPSVATTADSPAAAPLTPGPDPKADRGTEPAAAPAPSVPAPAGAATAPMDSPAPTIAFLPPSQAERAHPETVAPKRARHGGAHAGVHTAPPARAGKRGANRWADPFAAKTFAGKSKTFTKTAANTPWVDPFAN